MKSGSINLGATRFITGRVPQTGRATIQMLSANVSATTTFGLELSVDGVDFDVATESGTDVTDTLVVDEAKVFSFVADPGLKFRINFADATTGVVTYHTTGL